MIISSELKGEEMKVCDLKYLTEMMGSKNNLIIGIMEAFLVQIPEELKKINEAVKDCDFSVIKSYAHTMKSSVSIMGIARLTPILQEMEDLGTKKADIERIEELRLRLNIVCAQAIQEVEKEKLNYV